MLRLISSRTSLFAIFLLAILPGPLFAQDFWNDPNGGFYDSGSNWLSGIVPGTNEDITFDLNSQYSVFWNELTGNTQSGDLDVRGGNVSFVSLPDAPGTILSHVASSLYVGGGGTELTLGGIGNAFDLSTGSLLIEGGSGNAATLSVDQGSRLTFINGQIALGEFNVRNESRVVSTGTSIFGSGSSASTVLVSGESNWANRGLLTVGSVGTTNFTVASNGVLSSGQLIVGVGTDNPNFTANANFNILTGGQVSVLSASLATEEFSTANVLIDGAGSRFSVTNPDSSFNIGSRGNASVTVSNGGSMESNGRASIGGIAGGQGSVRVEGIGSSWISNHSMFIGLSTSGKLEVVNGGLVQSAQVQVGDQALVEGIDATLSTQFLVLGGAAGATLMVRDGGMLESDLTQVSGISPTYTGSISISDGEWLNAGDVSIQLGGSVSVTDGGSTVVGGLTELGGTIQEGGSLLVEGVDSSWATRSLEVGTRNFGSLEIGDNGELLALDTEIGSEAIVRVNGGHFEFGTMNAASATETAFDGYARIVATSGSLSGTLNNNGFLTVPGNDLDHGAATDASGVQLVNAGTIHGSGSISASLDNQTTGEVQLINGEALRFSGSGSNSGEVNLYNGLLRFENQLTNQAGGFIGGRGALVANGGISNESVMAFSGDTDISGDLVLTGNGQLITSGTSTLTLFDDVVHNGQEIRTSEGSNTVIFGGASGNGDYTGTGKVFFEGDLRPGNSPGIVSFEGDVVLGTFAESFFELGGVVAGDFDQLQITGDLTLDGLLSLSLLDGFILEDQMEFLIANVGGDLNGQFSGLTEGDIVGHFGGFNLSISYAAGNGNDVSLFASAIPEPGTIGLVGLMMVLIGTRRRRPRS